MTESIADLQKRRDLLREIKELAQWCPDEDNAERAVSFLATLKEIAETDYPDEDQMEAVHSYHAALREIEKYDAPDDDAMKEASDHLATLKAIENHTS